ncbi:MAG: MarR family winged helix-turn-helix transcriptional regulator [Clostridiales bacterium]|nr:MarR family winged helix-turn-helix transcriptional regulator [Clostridiales bacterium]
MDYISETLGVTVTKEPWSDFSGLPIFIFNSYDIQKVALGGVPCLFVKPKGELPTIPALKKHLEIIGEKGGLPRVAILDSINARQRKALINARISFVVDKTQLYLPFMGILLSERFNKPKAISEILMPSAQMLLFHYLYQGKKELFTSGIADKLNFSQMQISRAVKQLSLLGLVNSSKVGVRVFIEGTEEGKALFGKAKPFLLNPVRKRLFIEADALPKDLPLSGLSALAEYSMLAEPNVAIYAYFGKVSDIQGTDMLVDEGQVELEIWQYDPVILSRLSGIADPLSVAVSLQNIDDPRVEQAIEEMGRETFSVNQSHPIIRL